MHQSVSGRSAAERATLQTHSGEPPNQPGAKEVGIVALAKSSAPDVDACPRCAESRWGRPGAPTTARAWPPGPATAQHSGDATQVSMRYTRPWMFRRCGPGSLGAGSERQTRRLPSERIEYGSSRLVRVSSAPVVHGQHSGGARKRPQLTREAPRCVPEAGDEQERFTTPPVDHRQSCPVSRRCCGATISVTCGSKVSSASNQVSRRK